MSRQIQIRRGDVAANDNFIGAIGEVTMDTTNNTLRVHDGETLGGTVLAKQSEIPDLSPFDYVVAWQMPTSENNYTWYRKYKSGWVEMGGTLTIARQDQNTSLFTKVNFPIEMLNKNYNINALSFITDGGATTGLRNQLNNRERKYMEIGTFSTTPIVSNYTAQWGVCGIAA